MKNIMLALCLIVLPLAVRAAVHETYQRGDIVAGVGVKSSTPGLGTDWGEFNVDNRTTGVAHDAKLGNHSIGADVQGVYFLNEWLAAGVSLGDEYFPRERASGLDKKVSTRIHNYMALARVYLTPNQPCKVYIPVAVGVADISAAVYMREKERFNYTGFASHFGLGVERFMDEHWLLGAEMRYNYNRFHRAKDTSEGYVQVYPSANYISFSLRAGYRF